MVAAASTGGSLAIRRKSSTVYCAVRRISLMIPSGEKPGDLPTEAHTAAPKGKISSWTVRRSTMSRGSRRPYAAEPFESIALGFQESAVFLRRPGDAFLAIMEDIYIRGITGRVSGKRRA